MRSIVRRLIIAAVLSIWGALAASPATAEEVTVAVAANFTEPARQIAGAFEKATGDHVTLSFGASGQFYTQIANGAPFEVFLSADADRPAKAEQAGLAVSGSRFTYAVGKLVLWSPTAGLVDAKGAVLRGDRFAKLSIADPAAAPYGVAAIQTMKTLGVYDRVQPRIVQGASIAQAFQFVKTGNAELGFVALSQVINEPGGSRWLVPEADHDPIVQQAVLLKTAGDSKAAREFLAFLKSARAGAIIHRFGYATP
ncbi:MAG TPA: molybdate ABC transporter substrate-binding protein [Caulobacteraceae bacterium]|jgi:molybdate transport system substrate-binding protein|nr:molybdate ABC transporter substrate-binding protein [Caulobacteraceae bacterium]